MSPDEGIFPPILTRSAEIYTSLFYISGRDSYFPLLQAEAT